MKSYVFIKNALVLTVTSLLLRSVGIVFRVYLAGKIGAEGMGLYQLIFSVYMLAATFATCGVCTAVTRLVAENSDSKHSIIRIMKKSVLLTVVVALLSQGLVFLGADFISEMLLGDIRAAMSLKIMSFSLMFMGLSSCIKGYFIARRKVMQPSFAQIAEQFVRIAVILLCIDKFSQFGLEFTCAAVLLGDTVAEIGSCLVVYILYLNDKKKLPQSNKRLKGIYRSILSISLPIAGGKYATTTLHTVENIIVPMQIALFTLSKGDALSQFGMIKGMAIPILFFPASFLGAMSTMLVPEISEAMAKGRTERIVFATSKAIRTTITSSILIASVFFAFSNEIGILIYKSEQVGFMIKMLAPIVPFMYLECVVDGILKGLNQQLHSFWYNIIDSVARIGLIFLLVPYFGVTGFLAVMIISNIITASLNCRRLLKVANMNFDYIKWVVVPIVAAVFSGITATFINAFFGSRFFILAIVCQCIIFFGMVFIMTPLKKEYMPWKISR